MKAFVRVGTFLAIAASAVAGWPGVYTMPVKTRMEAAAGIVSSRQRCPLPATGWAKRPYKTKAGFLNCTVKPVNSKATVSICNQDFETSWTGWMAVNGNGDVYQWMVGTTGDIGSNIPPTYGTQYAYYSDDDAGNAVVNTNEEWVSPAFEIPEMLPAINQLNLQYGWGFRVYETGENFHALVRVFSGSAWADWDTLITYTGSGSGSEAFDLSGYLPADSIQVKWVYEDVGTLNHWGFACAVDNVILAGQVPLADDVGLYAIRVPPPDSSVAPNSSVTPVVTVKNYGLNTAIFNITLNIDSLGANVFSNTQMGIILASSETLQVSFPNWNTGSTVGTTYNLTAFTTYPADLFNSNDTLTSTTNVSILTWLLNSPFRTVIPTIDGVINPAEWFDALKNDVSDIYGYGGVPSPAGSVFLYVKNDSNNLYLAVDGIVDTTADNDDAFWQYYDDNNDGTYPAWPDSSEGELNFGWWSTGDTITFSPSTNDFGALSSYVTTLNGISGIISGNMQYELALPLAGPGGLNESMQAAAGDTIALWFFIGDASTYTIYGWWPTQATSGWGNPADMGNIVLSTSPSGVGGESNYGVDILGFSLSNNYPNPFTSGTNISYALPKDGRVTLAIYNIAGQLVKTLVDEIKPAGYYQARWNVNNMANGIYFYQLKAGDFRATRKMMMVK